LNLRPSGYEPDELIFRKTLKTRNLRRHGGLAVLLPDHHVDQGDHDDHDLAIFWLQWHDTAMDEYTRECLAIDVGRTFTARDVILTLQYLFAVRGAPDYVRSDNGPAFIAQEIQRWLGRAAVGTLYLQKASPWEKR